jgi:hypothetical protein
VAEIVDRGGLTLLEDLEEAAHDGRLAGFGPRRLLAAR